MFVPASQIGWYVMPVGIAIRFFVIYKKIHPNTLAYYIYLGAAWTIIAIVCDYLFLVLLLHPADGYYKLDVYLYYAFTCLLPMLVGWIKSRDIPTSAD